MSFLIDHFKGRQEIILDNIRELVERETTSGEAARLDEMAHFIGDKLSELGGRIELFPQPGYGTHLRARFGCGHDAKPSHVLVIGHLDTVWPVGTLGRLPFRRTPEGSVYGPGIFDMKSGLAILVESLRAISELGLRTEHPITVLLTCDEEIGSRTSRTLIEETAIAAGVALVLEPPIPGGVVKTGRKGIGTFTVRAAGCAAHAGLDPQKGVNAVVELAHQTVRLSALNDFDRGVTVSVGSFHGGTAINVIPAEAIAEVDVRFWKEEDGREIERSIRGLEPVLEGARLEISGGINRPPMIRSQKNIALFEHARDLAAELGFELREQVVGGGSDGNFTSALGIPTLDGLGVDGDGAHAEHEHILLDDIPRRAALLTRLLQTT